MTKPSFLYKVRTVWTTVLSQPHKTPFNRVVTRLVSWIVMSGMTVKFHTALHHKSAGNREKNVKTGHLGEKGQQQKQNIILIMKHSGGIIIMGLLWNLSENQLVLKCIKNNVYRWTSEQKFMARSWGEVRWLNKIMCLSNKSTIEILKNQVKFRTSP